MRAGFRKSFGAGGWVSDLSIICHETRGRSGARTREAVDGTTAGVSPRPKRFRLRYSRIQAALCAGSR